MNEEMRSVCAQPTSSPTAAAALAAAAAAAAAATTKKGANVCCKFIIGYMSALARHHYYLKKRMQSTAQKKRSKHKQRASVEELIEMIFARCTGSAQHTSYAPFDRARELSQKIKLVFFGLCVVLCNSLERKWEIARDFNVQSIDIRVQHIYWTLLGETGDAKMHLPLKNLAVTS